jgi:hypothetical protein
MLGCASDAEDVVQETWLAYADDRDAHHARDARPAAAAAIAAERLRAVDGPALSQPSHSSTAPRGAHAGGGGPGPHAAGWSTISQAFERIAVRASLPVIRLHDVRHNHATLLLQQGIPVKVVSERLGHANAAFTIRPTGTCCPARAPRPLITSRRSNRRWRAFALRNPEELGARVVEGRGPRAVLGGADRFRGHATHGPREPGRISGSARPGRGRPALRDVIARKPSREITNAPPDR